MPRLGLIIKGQGDDSAVPVLLSLLKGVWISHLCTVYFIDLCFTKKAVGFLPLLEVCPVYVIYAY